jgi:hypothetical protein
MIMRLSFRPAPAVRPRNRCKIRKHWRKSGKLFCFPQNATFFAAAASPYGSPKKKQTKF